MHLSANTNLLQITMRLLSRAWVVAGTFVYDMPRLKETSLQGLAFCSTGLAMWSQRLEAMAVMLVFDDDGVLNLSRYVPERELPGGVALVG